jgi:hypothetical protein
MHGSVEAMVFTSRGKKARQPPEALMLWANPEPLVSRINPLASEPSSISTVPIGKGADMPAMKSPVARFGTAPSSSAVDVPRPSSCQFWPGRLGGPPESAKLPLKAL